MGPAGTNGGWYIVEGPRRIPSPLPAAMVEPNFMVSSAEPEVFCIRRYALLGLADSTRVGLPAGTVYRYVFTRPTRSGLSKASENGTNRMDKPA